MIAKRIMAGLLCAIFCVSIMTACSISTATSDVSKKSQSSQAGAKKEKGEAMHKLYIRAPKKFDDISAEFQNTATAKTKNVKMKISSEKDNVATYCCEADTNMYNMVKVKYDKKESMDFAFNTFTSGWNIVNDDFLPYVEGKEPSYNPEFEKKGFKFDGYDKSAYIWTPVDYDAKSDEKYSVIYMFDAQSALATGKDDGMDNDYVCLNAAESVNSMMAETGNKAIVVAIESHDAFRWDELVPDLGEINTEDEYSKMNTTELTKKRGTAFADFLCDTVMPYINKNYNVYTDAQHTALSGSSLGGLETFYTVLTHPDKFGTGGIMSATFDMYAEKEWNEFLKDKMNMENAPLLYFYAGGYTTDNGDVTETMYNKLIENGYAKDKLVFSKYETGEHLIEYWRNILPEYYEAVFTHDVPALEFGVPVKYKNTKDPNEELLEEMELEMTDIKPGYVYYDNSETKWDKVYAYWWGGMSFNTMTKESYYFGDWPGIEMEQIKGTDIYRIIAPIGVTGIIFDSGVSDRDVANGKEAYQTVDLEYSKDKIGKVYKIDTSVKPKADPGNMKTKHRYSAGKWSDYSGNK